MSDKIVYLLVGAPGSGKTHWTNQNFPGAPVASADHYFETPKGYKFDPDKLSVAHRASQKTCHDAMRAAAPVVVVDNTLTRHRERREYLEMAQQFSYEARVVVFPDRGFTNVHGVPKDKVASMRARIDLEPGEYTWDGKAYVKTGEFRAVL